MATVHSFISRLRRQAEPAAPNSREQLLEDIREVRRQLEGIHSYFALETDGDLLEAAIYQRDALEARYRYLLRLARESKTTAAAIPLMTEEERWIN